MESIQKYSRKDNLNAVMSIQWCSSRDLSLGLETSRVSNAEVLILVLKVQVFS